MNTYKKSLARKLVICIIACVLLCVLALVSLNYISLKFLRIPEPSDTGNDPSVNEPQKPIVPGLQGSTYLSFNDGIQVGLGISGNNHYWDILDYDSGKFHILVVDKEGFVYARGSNEYKQLGLEGAHNSTASNYFSTSNYYTYLQPVMALNHIKVTKVAAGGYHSIAIGHDPTKTNPTSAADYKVYTWGRQDAGALGNNSTSSTPQGVPQDITSRFNFAANEYPIDVEAGEYHSMLLTNLNNIYTWGDNTYGQLGTGNLNRSAVPVKITVSGVGFKAISAGSVHSMALATDGRLFTWGGNTNRQLGGSTDINLKRTTPTHVFSGTTFTDISAGELHSGAVKYVNNNNTTIYLWGDRRGGKLGDGHTGNGDTDAKEGYSSYSGYKAVACGGKDTLAIRASDNRLFVTGFGVNVYYPGKSANGTFQDTGYTASSASNGGMNVFLSTNNELFAIGYASRYDENWYGRPIEYDGNGKPITSPPSIGDGYHVASDANDGLKRLTPAANIVGLPTNYIRATKSTPVPNTDPTNGLVFNTTRVKINAFTNYTDFAVAQLTKAQYDAANYSGVTFKSVNNKGVLIDREGYYVVKYNKRGTVTYTKFTIANNSGPEVVVSSDNSSKYYATIKLFDGFGLGSVTVSGTAKIYNPADPGTYTDYQYNGSQSYTSTTYEALFTIPYNSKTTFRVTAKDSNNIESTYDIVINTSVCIANGDYERTYDGTSHTTSPMFHRPSDGVGTTFNAATLQSRYGFTVTESYSGTPINAGNYTYSVTVKNGSTTVESKQINIKVNQRPITVTAQAMSKVYAQSDPDRFTYTITSGNLVGTDTIEDSGRRLTRDAGENAGQYNINLGSLGNPNYKITYVGAKFTIHPKNINDADVTVSGVGPFVYKAAAYTPEPTVRHTTRGTGGTTLTKGTEITFSYDTGTNVNVGSSQITIQGVSNYTGTRTLSFSIVQASVKLTPNNIVLTYGDRLDNARITGTAVNASFESVNVAGSWSFVGSINNDPLCSDSGTYTVKYTIADTHNYIQPENKTITVTINKRQLTIQNVTAVTKIYDRSTEMQLTGGTLVGVQYSDSLTVNLGVAHAPTADVGTHQLSVNIVVTGPRRDNYEFIQPQIQGTIEKKAIEGNVTVAEIPFQYFADRNIEPTPEVWDTAFGLALIKDAEIAYSYSNNYSVTDAAFVTINGINNYKGTIVVTFEIRKVGVAINPNDIVLTYGQSLSDATITGTARNAFYTDVDVLGVWEFVSAINNQPICADSGIYTVRFKPTLDEYYYYPEDTTLTLTVLQKQITIVGSYAVDRYYDGTTIVQLAGGSLVGLVYSDQIGIVHGTGNIHSKDVGYYTVTGTNIQLSGERAVNYILTQPEGLTVTISPKILDTASDLTWEDLHVTYDGQYQYPKPWVADSIQSLVEGTDFRYGDYSNNLFAGVASIAIHGIGNYTGSNTITFTVDQRTIEILYSNYDLTFNGQPQTVTASAYNLVTNVLSVDIDVVNLTVTGDTNTVAGNYTITVTALDNPNYKLPEITWFNYTIKPKDIGEVMIAAMDPVVYTGSVIRRTPAVTDLHIGVDLIQNEDFVYGYGSGSDNINAIDGRNDEGFVIITGIGNYTGTKEARYDILPKPLAISGANPTATVEAVPAQTYTGRQLTPKPAVTDIARAAGLIENFDFEYGYGENTNVLSGSLIEGTIYIIGRGNYSGTVQVSFDIRPKTITLTAVQVAQIAPVEYNGYRHTPEPAITDIDREAGLVKGTDFAYTYGTNIDCSLSGTNEGSITITGMGNYTGSITVNFDITPKPVTALIGDYYADENLIRFVYNGKTREIVVSPVGIVQRDIDNNTVPVFTVDYLSGRPLNVLSDNRTYPVRITLDRTRFPNYAFQQIDTAVKIEPKPVSIAFEGYEDLVYDGIPKQIIARFANEADICTNDAGIRDNVSILISRYQYIPYIGEPEEVDAIRNAGTYSVSVALSSINYIMSSESELSFSVARRELVVKAEDRSKLFGAEDNIATHFTQRVNSGTADGFINVVLIRDKSSDNVLDYESVGSYPYIGIEEQNNYIFSLAPDSGTFNITRRSVSIIPIKRQKVYGEPDPTDLSQALNTAYYNIRLVFDFKRVEGENVGVYAIDTAATTVSYFRYENGAYIEDPSLAQNFNVSSFNAQDWFTITRRPINVYMGEFEKVYSHPDPVYTYDVDTENLAEWDKAYTKEELFPNFTVVREKGEDVRTAGYALTLDLGNNNYEARMTGPARLIIRKLAIADAFDLTEIFNVQTTKIYDGTIRATVIANLPELLKKTGFGVTATFNKKDAGSNLTITLVYKINSASMINFEIPGESTIEGCQILPRPITVSFKTPYAQMVYGSELPGFEFIYSGFVNGDNAESIGIEGVSVNYGSLYPFSDVGLYPVTLYGRAEYGNYRLDLSATGTVEVTPAPIEIRAGNPYVRSVDSMQSREVGELIQGEHYYFVGLFNDDTVSLLPGYTAILDSGAPGTTKARLYGLEIDNPNYHLVNTTLAIDAIIKPLPVIRIDSATFDYDGKPKSLVPSVKVDNVPIYDYKVVYSGIDYNNLETPPTNAGTYTVRVTTTSDEYAVITATATLTIRRVSPTITITGSFNQVYGNFKPLTAVAKGPGGFEEVLPIQYPFELVNGRAPVGEHTIKVGFDGNQNFFPVSAEQNTVTLKVEPKAISVTFSGYRGLVYDGQAHPVEVAFQGVLEGDTVLPRLDYNGLVPVNAGTYTATVYIDNPNYKIVGTSRITYTIAKRDLKVHVKSVAFVDNKPQFELDFEGFAEGDTPDCLKGMPSARLQTMYDGDNTVVLYSGVEDPNYNIVIENEKNATAVIVHPPRKEASSNALTIALASVGGACVLIGSIAAINAKKAKKASYRRDNPYMA